MVRQMLHPKRQATGRPQGLDRPVVEAGVFEQLGGPLFQLGERRRHELRGQFLAADLQQQLAAFLRFAFHAVVLLVIPT